MSITVLLDENWSLPITEMIIFTHMFVVVVLYEKKYSVCLRHLACVCNYK